MADLARIVMERIYSLAQISEEPNRLTRTFCSPAMRRANDLVGSWMKQAGMEVHQDAIGNLIGRYSSESVGAKSKREESKILLLGSHLDTVRDAGKFDGPLGVLAAIACVQKLHDRKTRLPFEIQVVGFADEEGVRYKSTYLGSRVLAGTFDSKLLTSVDAKGTTMARAIRDFGGNPAALAKAGLDRGRLLGYLETHIEQGPVLEERDLSVGVVTAIAGQTRAEYRFLGTPGHAGTVPMELRSDALCAAAEFVLLAEHQARMARGLVATVGEITALPGAGNVIPGEARLSLDVRHADDAVRRKACARFKDRAARIAAARKLSVKMRVLHEARSVLCDKNFSRLLNDIVTRHQGGTCSLPSGAGHDAAAMAAICPVAMLFVRCKGGISHHPDESAKLADVRVAVSVMHEFIHDLARRS